MCGVRLSNGFIDIDHIRSLVGRQMGVSPQGMGFIFAFIPIAGIVVKPFLGGIADKYEVLGLVWI